jgi:hypothetical protein
MVHGHHYLPGIRIKAHKAEFAQDHFKALNQRLREVNPSDLPEHYRGSVHQQYYS